MVRPRPALFLIPTLVLLASAPALAGPSYDLVFHSNLDEHNGHTSGGGSLGPFHYNDVWGYTAPNGDEYVLLGLYDGFAVVNVVDPYEPYEVAFFPDVASVWRDVKTYEHYAYVTNETSGGLMIVDLADPENPVRIAGYHGFSTAHNLYIDTATGYAYIAGSGLGNGGVRILQLAGHPETPIEVSSWETAYFHDVMVQNGRLYGSAIYDGVLYVLDVSNPAAPFIPVLGTASGYPNAFTHNAWVTGDDAYVMSTDENSPGRCRMWDLSTLPNLVETDSYKPNAVTIPHNTHIEGDLAFISFYELGVKVVDISDPFDLTEVAAWDTWPAGDGSEYHGCWGAYPFFETSPDLLAVTDGATGLYLFSYVGPLGTVAGRVTESGAGTDIPGARVEILASGFRGTTDAGGLYSVQDAAGPVDLEVSAYGYESQTVQATIVTGQTTTVDVSLVPLPRAAITGRVTEAGSGQVLAGAEVEVLGTPLSGIVDGLGDYRIESVPEGNYTVRASAFGVTPMQADVSVVGGIDLTVDFPLNPALVALDFESAPSGWTVTGGATDGIWALGDPEGTFSGGIPVQPEDDHTPVGTVCWVTGPTSGGSVGANDVDNGATILTTPTYALGSTTDPHVSYWRWYSTGIGNANIDAWVVEVSANGGGTWVDVENTVQTSNAWIKIDVKLDSLITPSNLVQFRFTAQDTGVGGIVEAALDDFMIYDGVDQITGTSAPIAILGGSGPSLGPARPNPIRPGAPAVFDLSLPRAGLVEATVHDVQGRRIAVLSSGRLEEGRHRLVWDGRRADAAPVAAGVYFLRVRTDEGIRSRKVLLVR